MRALRKIKSIAIENTTLCGADCIMCPRHDFKHKKQNMPWHLFKRSVDEAVSCGVEFINICGFGDPAIDSNFVEELRYVKTVYPNVILGTTNTCHLVKGEILDAVCEFVDEMQISMYGITKESYESVHRGGLKFEEVKHNIDILLERKKRPQVVMEFLLMPENQKDMKEWLNYYKDKAERCDIWKLQNWGGWLPNQDSDKPFVKCFRISTLNGLYIRADGSVSMCCVDYNRKLTLGNINDQSLQDILNNEITKNMQIMNENGSIKEYSICKNCDQIHDRSEALVYSTDEKMSIGKHSLFMKADVYD